MSYNLCDFYYGVFYGYLLIVISRYYVVAGFTGRQFHGSGFFGLVLVYVRLSSGFVVLYPVRRIYQLSRRVLCPIVSHSLWYLICIISLLTVSYLCIVSGSLYNGYPTSYPIQVYYLGNFFRAASVYSATIVGEYAGTCSGSFIVSSVVLVWQVVLKDVANVSTRVVQVYVFAKGGYFLYVYRLIPYFFYDDALLVNFVYSFLGVGDVGWFYCLVYDYLVIFYELYTLQVFCLVIIFTIFISASNGRTYDRCAYRGRYGYFLSRGSLLYLN